MKVDYIFEKGSKENNEDAVLIGKNIFGVFDGATSLNKFTDKDGKTGGFIASSIAKEVFEKEKGELADLAVKANKKIKEEMIKRNIDISDKQNLWCSTVAVVKIGKDFFEWIQLADSLIIIIFQDDSFRLLITDYDLDKETTLRWKEMATKKINNIREILDNQIRKVRGEANLKYGVLNGEEKMINFLNKGRESLKNIKNIIIFTDGLILPKENPEAEDDFNLFVELYRKGGLNKVKEYVRKLENSDPNGWKYNRSKQHDDIAAVSISF